MKAIRTWPEALQKEGQALLATIAVKLLVQANQPKYQWVQAKVLRTLIDCCPGTNAARDAQRLLEKMQT